MILHVATFVWVDKVTPDDVAGLTASLQAMAAEVPELLSYVCGENLRIRPGADYAVAAVVADEAALESYLDSVAHQQVYQEWLSWMIDSRQAAQLPVSEAQLG